MKKKLLTALSLVCIAMSAFLFASCDLNLGGDENFSFDKFLEKIFPKTEEHVHSFGKWTNFTDGDVVCEDKLFFRTCSTCNEIEWKQGVYEDHDWNIVTTAPTCQAQGYDTKTCTICRKVEITNYTKTAGHAWNKNYSFDNSYHWIGCYICGEVKGKEKHKFNSSCNATQHWEECICGQKRNVAGHSFVVKKDATNHWEECTCGQKRNKAEHIDNGSGNCSACDQLIERIEYKLLADGTYAVCGYAGEPTEVVIPSIFNGKAVTSIGEYAFYDCRNLTSVEIPDSVTTIGSYAFEDCSSLTNVVIGDGVTMIGEGAFDYCSKLSYKEYGNCKYLGSANNPYYALMETASKNYSTYTMHENTKIIEGEAFSGCSRMSSITIPDSVYR